MGHRIRSSLLIRVGSLLAGRGVGNSVAVLKHGIQSYCGSVLLADGRSS